MEISINKKIGSNVLQIKIEERDDKEAMARAIFFLEKDTCLFIDLEEVLLTKGDVSPPS